MKHGILFLLALGWSSLAAAGEVRIVEVKLDQRGYEWSASVTLEHADTGWKHYADAWRLVTEDGTEFARRTLHHPHVNEQPFARSLSGIVIPKGTKVIFVEAHDKVHGWSPDRVRIDLARPKGPRYRIRTQ